MDTVKIPIFERTYTNVDGVELSDANARFIGGYKTETGAMTNFPGLTQMVTLELASDGLDGLYWWGKKSLVIAVAGGHIFRLEYNGTTITKTDITGVALASDTRVSFADNGEYVLMANGGNILYTDGYTATQAIADTDAPTNVTHIAYIDSYFLANSVGTERFYYSEVLDPFSWNALNLAQAVGLPDKLNAIVVFERQIFLSGQDSTELWANDGNNPFSRISGGFFEAGCMAPNSFVKDREALYWLSDDKVFVRSNGGRPEPLPSAFDVRLRALTSPASCLGDTVVIGGKRFLVFSFPGDNLTLLYNLKQNDWTELGLWKPESLSFDRWIGNCVCDAKGWGMQLVGDRRSGLVYKLDPASALDGTVPISVYWESGHIGYGTTKEKVSQEIRFRAKRGHTSSLTTEPKLTISWLDNNVERSQEQEVSLGLAGDTDIVVRLFRNGIFRTRKYVVRATAGVDFVIADAEEDVEVLTR